MKGKKKRSGGGGVMKVSGNPNVFKEAAARKDGGRVKSEGTVIGRMTGGAVRPRLDRPGRKAGGRVGSNAAPLSSAHATTSPDSKPKSQDGAAS